MNFGLKIKLRDSHGTLKWKGNEFLNLTNFKKDWPKYYASQSVYKVLKVCLIRWTLYNSNRQSYGEVK